jgi:hypothetical protein
VPGTGIGPLGGVQGFGPHGPGVVGTGHGAAIVHGLGCGGAGTRGWGGGAGAGTGFVGGGSGSGTGTTVTGAAAEASGAVLATLETAALTGVGLSGEPQAERASAASSTADFIGTAFLKSGFTMGSVYASSSGLSGR